MLSRRRLVAIALVALFAFGFIFFRGPTPHITIKPETLFHAGPIAVTNTMFTSWLVVATLIVAVFLATRRWEIVPSGVQNVIEAILEAFYNLVISVAGEKNGRRFFPVVATIFFFVLASNWLSLLPVFNSIGGVEKKESGFVMQDAGGIAYVPLSGPGALSGETIDEKDANAPAQYEKAKSEGKTVGELVPFLRGPNTDLNTPLALAIASMIAVETWGVTSLGLFAYGNKFVRPGGVRQGLRGAGMMLLGALTFKLDRFMDGLTELLSGVADVFVGVLELISELVRLVSFTFRLFGNMFAGEVVILMFTFLTPLVLTVVFYGLELFVGVIQAFIFAMLTLVFGMMAVAHGEAHAAEEKRGGLEGAIQETA